MEDDRWHELVADLVALGGYDARAIDFFDATNGWLLFALPETQPLQTAPAAA